MPSEPGFFDKLQSDMLEQFSGKPNIEVYQKALARQLEELYVFFAELNTLRRLQDAEGVQLDGIGDIVVMSRMDAIVVSMQADQNVPMDDATYRDYLKWKIALNTTNCTHADRHRALKMFWDKTPLYYSEDPDYPATIFLTVPEFIPDAHVLRIALMIKAAGVGMHFRIVMKPLMAPLKVGGAAIGGTIGVVYPKIENRFNPTGDIRYGGGAYGISDSTVYPEN